MTTGELHEDPASGVVLERQPMELPPELQEYASGEQITYMSTDVFGNPVRVTGAIFTPYMRHEGANIVAFAHGTTGVNNRCAPSSNLGVFWPEAVESVRPCLEQGWAVVGTDYQGLGDDGDHQYLVGESEARAVIDSVRAARSLDQSLSSSWIVTGHSEGGQAALFAGEIADSYGAGLDLKAVVAMAPVSNFGQLLRLLPSEELAELNGYLPLMLFGYLAYQHAAQQDASIGELLAQPALKLYPLVRTETLEGVLAAFASLPATEFLQGGELPTDVVRTIAAYADPAQRPSTVPVLIVQGMADPLVQLTPILEAQVRAHDVTCQAWYYDGVDHDNIPIASAQDVIAYMQAHFADQSMPGGD